MGKNNNSLEHQLTDQKISVDRCVSNENKFIIKLMKEFNDNENLLFIKSKDKYSKLDISIINQFNLKNVFIEVKCRKNSIKNYKDYCIGKAKIDSFTTEYKSCLKSNCFIIFTFTDDSDLYYLNFDIKLKKKFRIGTMFGSSCYFIDKKFFKVGVESLLKELKSMLY